jgi:hypothetical protein
VATVRYLNGHSSTKTLNALESVRRSDAVVPTR